MDHISLRCLHIQKRLQLISWLCKHRTISTTPSKPLPTFTKSRIKELSATDNVAEEKTRNIGILAHIDAGKTTTTERMLFASGLTRHVGNVDSGDTVMDYLPQERERGITINSATITFPWKDYRINLIDTPGHVDFTVEVERTLLALDGVVIILDASKGVQAQTLTVWRQAVRFGLPAIIYLNKMDKPGASVPRCIQQLQKKLGLQPLPLQLPFGDGKNFAGVLNVLEMEKNQHLDNVTELKKARQVVLERLADVDDDFADLYLNSKESLDRATIESEIREACLKRQLAPLLVGSSLKNVGVPALLDAVVKFLPNPLELHKPVVSERLANSTGFYGLAFKNVHDKQKGLLTFLRIYRGSLRSNTSVYNVNKQQREKVTKIHEAYADELREIPEAREGNIAVLSGLKETVTGDTLVGSAPSATSFLDGDSPTEQVAVLRIPDPVYFCSVEAESPSKQQALEDVLGIIMKEDPSVRVRPDPETGQLVLSGMGELHLEILKDRIKQEYGLDAYLGPLQVAYKETISAPAEHSMQLVREVQGAHQRVDIHLRMRPVPESGTFRKCKLVGTQDFDWTKVNPELIKAVDSGVAAALTSGAVMGYPIIDVKVDLVKVTVARGTLPPLISAAASQCVRAMLKATTSQLLQPLMNIAVTVPSDGVHDVLADLARRHAQIKEIDVLDEETRTVNAECPLAEMMHFSRDIRTATHGLAHISVELGRYEVVEGDRLAKLQREKFLF